MGVSLRQEINLFLDNQLQDSSILSQYTVKAEPNPSSGISSGPWFKSSTQAPEKKCGAQELLLKSKIN